MAWLSPRLESLCNLLNGRDGASWSGPESVLVVLARRHRVEPLLYIRLATTTRGWRPAKETMDTLARDYRKNTERVLRSLAWLQRLTQALAAEGIEARPLKGLPLADQACERIADRHCGDLDLLIDGGRLRERADRVVRASGLRPEFEMTESALSLHRTLNKEDSYVSPDGIGVELHYRRNNIERYVFPDFMAFGSAAWQACRIESAVTHRLHGTPLLLYLLSHGTRCGWHRVKWLMDLRQLTHHFDGEAWTELRDAARKENLGPQVHIGLQLLAGIFAVPCLPASQSGSNALGSGFMLRHCRTELNAESGLPDTVWTVMRRILYGFLVQTNWRVRLAVAGKTLIRVPDIARWRLPVALIWILAPITRPFRLVYRRALRPAARRLYH